MSEGYGRSSRQQERAAPPAGARPLLVFIPYMARYPLVLAAAVSALLLSAAATLALPLMLRGIVDTGFAGGDEAAAHRYFAALLALGLVLAAASALRFYTVNWLGERAIASIQQNVFAHLTRLGPAFFEKNHSAEVMSRLTADTTQIKTAAGTAVSQALRNAIMLVGALALMIITSPSLSGLVLAAIPLIVLPLIAYGRAVRRLSRRAQDELARASAYAAENLAFIRTLQAYTHEEVAASRYSQAVERSFRAARARLLARAGLTALAIGLISSSVIGVLWYGAAAVLSGNLSAGRLGQFVLYAILAAASLAELSEVWGELSQASGAAGRLNELLALTPEISSPPCPVPLPCPARGEIVFQSVSFSYPGRDNKALDNVSFRVGPGETVALVGPSGAGKSTLFSLLLRFYDPQAGSIRLDGVSLSDAALPELRARFALVPQDVAIFSGTVASNIRYGAPEASLEEAMRAAHLAQAAEFIAKLPQGYETELGERGITLSGGQRQRIALARALLKDAPILLLDEATSALDAGSEHLVQRALETVMKGRTTLVIAHRLATVLKANRILVFDQGRLVEEGTHAALLQRGGLYSRLAALQFTSGNTA